MKKRGQNKIPRDNKFISFFKSRVTYVLVLIAVLIYLFQENKMLNEPYYLTFILYLISIGIVVLIFAPRFKRYRQFYISELKRLYLLDKIIVFLGIALVVFILQSILSIPLNFVIKECSRGNNVEYYDC